ncbi:hypothetical protein BT96DRAFT_387259 [Gymnopus androsaceus JB14]|uniref:Uncharacterized protein n=1 Tax=Gymnopus androsaceus JB14 TaxID=1447944 RepID=A0A6A4I3I5_9AGAR|nr:hypothetical protein BT96DRAFT_387259 [Gymnopus androsaceus JB14]
MILRSSKCIYWIFWDLEERDMEGRKGDFTRRSFLVVVLPFMVQVVLKASMKKEGGRGKENRILKPTYQFPNADSFYCIGSGIRKHGNILSFFRVGGPGVCNGRSHPSVWDQASSRNHFSPSSSKVIVLLT